MQTIPRKYQAVVIGVSAGGFTAIPQIISSLPGDFTMPIIIVQHISPDNHDSFFIKYLNEKCEMNVKEADEKEVIKRGNIYLAPPNYHLLVEKNKTFSLTVDDKVHYSRPAIDVLFETAADAYEKHLIGIILTGANSDGSCGMKKISAKGGLTIVQDPKTAEAPVMPQAAIKSCEIDHILTLAKIAELLVKI